MHQMRGCPARARPDARIKDVVSRPAISIAYHRNLPSVCSGGGHSTRSPQRLHVSCPAVEQDTDVPSTSGRPHPDSDLIHALFTSEPPTVTEPKVDIAKELNARIKAAGSLPQLCDLVQQEAQHFDYCTTSHALYRLSILCHAYFTQLQSAHLASRESQQVAWMEYVAPTLQMLGQLLLRHINSCDPWAVAISFWAYGNLQYTDEAVLAALCERGLQTMHTFTAVDCASSLVGIAKLRVRPRSQREFVDHLLSHTHELLSQVDCWGSQEVANVVWALSKMGAAGPSRRALMEGLLEMTLWRMADFSMQELAIIVYSCGRLRLRLPMQLVKITNHIAMHLTELNPQDAANVLWGCAKLDFKPGAELLERLPHVMVDRLSEFKPQEVCNLLYGYGHLRYEHTLLLEGVAKACTARLHEFSTQDLCLTLWSYGMLRYCPSDTALFDTACQVLLQRGNRLLPMELVMAVKGFARAGYQPPPEFMQQFAQLAILKLHQFKPIEWAQLLWAYAQVGYRDVPLFEAVVAHTIYIIQNWSRRLPKTTVDTILLSCERVGFWPQMLVDVAEMHGLYLKTSRNNTADMEELLPLGQPSSSSSRSGIAGDHNSADMALDADFDDGHSSSSSSSSNSRSVVLQSSSSGSADTIDAVVSPIITASSSSSSSSRPQLTADDLEDLSSRVSLAMQPLQPSQQQQQQKLVQEPSSSPAWPHQQQQQQQQPEASLAPQNLLQLEQQDQLQHQLLPQQPLPPPQQQQFGNSSQQQEQQEQQQQHLPGHSPGRDQQQGARGGGLQLQQPPKRMQQQQEQQQQQQQQQHRHLPVIITTLPPPAAAGNGHHSAGLQQQQQQQQLRDVGSSSSSSSSLNGHSGLTNIVMPPQQQ